MRKLDGIEVVRRYVGGESEKALATAYGVSRGPIRRTLVERGVEIRGRSAAMVVRCEAMSPAERCQLASAAHAALTGKKQRRSTLEARAASVERNPPNSSLNEQRLAEILASAGISGTPQKAVGIYNVDMAVGSLAIELLGGGWHTHKRHADRLRFLLTRGFDVLYIWVDPLRFPLNAGCVLANIRDFPQGGGPRYRIIRGDGSLILDSNVVAFDRLPSRPLGPTATARV